MAYKEVLRVEISEVIRRWQVGSSQRHIALGTGLSWETVGRYIAAAERLGVSCEGPAPHRPATESAGGERLLQGRNDIPPLNMPWPVLRLREQRAVGDEIERSTLLRNHHAFFRKPTSRVRARVVP